MPLVPIDIAICLAIFGIGLGWLIGRIQGSARPLPPTRSHHWPRYDYDYPTERLPELQGRSAAYFTNPSRREQP